jgi:transposase-like protein
MAALVRQWEQSTETRASFARRHGLTLASFEYWKRRVRREAVPTGAPTFAPVTVVADPAASEPRRIEVALATGERVIIDEGVSVDFVRTVVAALRPSC